MHGNALASHHFNFSSMRIESIDAPFKSKQQFLIKANEPFTETVDMNHFTWNRELLTEIESLFVITRAWLYLVSSVTAGTAIDDEPIRLYGETLRIFVIYVCSDWPETIIALILIFFCFATRRSGLHHKTEYFWQIRSKLLLIVFDVYFSSRLRFFRVYSWTSCGHWLSREVEFAICGWIAIEFLPR